MDDLAKSIIGEISHREINIIANRRQAGDATEYRLKEIEQREDNHIPPEQPVVFLEIEVGDASEFTDVLEVDGHVIEGEDGKQFKILRGHGSAVPNSIAAFLLHVRDTTGKAPHAYFSWAEGNPVLFLLRFILLGQGDTAPVTREVLRQAESDPERRPMIHAGG